MLKRLVLFLALLIPGSAYAQGVQTVDALIYVTGSCAWQSGSGSPNGAVTADVCSYWIQTDAPYTLWRKASGSGNTGWVPASLPALGSTGSFLRAGTVWEASTLILPNEATANRIPYATSTNTWGESANLTFDSSTFTTLAGVFTSLTTPLVYGSGSPNSLAIGGNTINGCATNPPTSINCEAATHTFASLLFEQRLVTNPDYRSRWHVNADRTILNSFNSNTQVFRPLTFEGLPVQIRKGGLHLGGTAGVANPGEGNAYIEGWMKSVNPAYSSQTSGMSVDFTNGSIDAQYIYSNEMHIRHFYADLSAALAGIQTISKSVAELSVDFVVPAGGSVSTLTVDDLPGMANTAVFESGDDIRLRQFSRSGGGLTVTDAYGKVTNYADGAVEGTQTWTFTRSLSPCSGAASTGAIIEADNAVLDYGVPGNGFIETNAIDGIYGINSPYIKAVTRGTCANDQTTQAKFGNLRGDTGVTEYGLLAGSYGGGSYIIMSNTRAEIRNVPLALYSGVNNTLYANPTLSSFAQATTNASTLTYSTGVGCWSGLDAGTFKWRCGDMSGDFIAWNGSTLNVNGNITVTGLIAEDTLAVDGVPAADVASGAARALLGIDANGNPDLPDVATPSGSGLFLGSDYMGYYASGVWKTYIASNGDFALGGASGNLTWVAATSTLTISATLSGNGSAITQVTGTNIITGSITATQIQAATITATQIASDTITAGNIAANAITTSELAADSVTSAKIVAGTIVASDIAAATITANEIATGTITATQIAAGTITATQIAGATITATQIQSGTITGTQIASNTIVAGNIDAGAITTTKILAGAVTADRIESNSITAAQIAANAIEASEIAANAVTTAKIDAGAITADKIGAGEITADKLDVSTLSAITADLGTVTAGSITGVSISAGSGAVAIDGDGITIEDWDSDDRKAVKWTGGARIFGYSDTLSLRSPDNANGINILSGGGIGVQIFGTLFTNSSVEFGTLSGGGTKIVCATNDGVLEYGCAESRLLALENEVKYLRATINALLGEKNGHLDSVLRPAIVPGRKN